MSAQTIMEAFLPAENAHRQVVMKATWGHLAPLKERIYEGRIVYSVGCLGSDNLNPTILVFDFGALDSSPWLYDAINDFIGDGKPRRTKASPYASYDGFSYMKCGRKNEPGCVYEWIGTVRNYVFKGTRRTLIDTNKRQQPRP